MELWKAPFAIVGIAYGYFIDLIPLNETRLLYIRMFSLMKGTIFIDHIAIDVIHCVGIAFKSLKVNV